VAAYEAGAAAGGLAAGWLSDAAFGGRRGPVIALMSLAAAPIPLALLALASEGAGAPPSSPPPSAAAAAAVAAAYAALGFFAFGPHVLNGLAAREYAPRAVQASAGGFSKALGQLGGTAAGYPLGLLLDRLGWRAAAAALAAAGLAAALCAAPLWNVLPEGAPPPFAAPPAAAPAPADAATTRLKLKKMA
jgi:sugar phosphate permease